MGPRAESLRGILGHARMLYGNNVRALTFDEALFTAGGHRSILGVLKHLGGWVHVYHSYAFDDAPKHWNATAWPRGLRDTVETSPEYVQQVTAWVDDGLHRWDDTLARIDDDEIDEPHPVHWGASMPLGAIAVMVAHEVMYHTGEINMLLSIARGEAWEYTEEVEENHISTYGHGVRPTWMSDDDARRHEAAIRVAHEARNSDG